MAPERKSDIKPLCDKHLVEMEADGTRRKTEGGADVWEYLVFHCTTPGCNRLLDRGEYITVSDSDGSLDPGSRNFISCEDGLMFIESVEGDRLIWRCCMVGCQRSRTTDRAFRPSDENTGNPGTNGTFP
jgi:hypothetical protein